MKKIIIVTIIAVLLLGASYFGTTYYLEAKAAVEDVPVFTAHTFDYNEYGYKPRTDIKLSKSELSAFLKLCDHEVTRLKSGDYLVEIVVEPGQRWVVKICDSENIRWLRRTTPVD